MKVDDRSYESVSSFKDLGTILKKQNRMREEIKGRYVSLNAC
jgi:hypothetical protein